MKKKTMNLSVSDDQLEENMANQQNSKS